MKTIFLGLSLILAVICVNCESGDEATIKFDLVNTTFDPSYITIELNDGLHTYIIDGDDYDMSSSGYQSKTYKTKMSGTLQISFTISADSPTPVVSGDFSIELKPDWRWTVDIFVTENNPIETCFGCFGSEEYDIPALIQRNPEDKLYFVWGGNSIKDPVIY